MHLDQKLIDGLRMHSDFELASGASSSSFSSVEAELGGKLPPSYKEFLAEANGGTLVMIRLFGVGREDYLDLLKNVTVLSQRIPAVGAGNMIPFATDFGGGVYCFDTKHAVGDGEFVIWHWNHEYSEEPADAPYVWSQLGIGFGEFLHRELTPANSL